MKTIVEFAVCLLTHILDIIIFSKIIEKKLNINVKKIVLVLVLTVIDLLISFNVNPFVKLAESNIITFIILECFFHDSFSKTTIGTLLLFLVSVLAELFSSIILYYALHLSTEYLTTNYIGIFIVNIVVYTVYILLIKLLLKVLRKIVKWYDDKNKVNNIINILLAYSMCSIFMYGISFNRVNNINDYLVLSIITLGIILFIGGFFKKNSDNLKLKHDYNEQLNYSKIYKSEVNSKGKLLHEYNNQLLYLKGMINKRNKSAHAYIDSLLEKYNKKIENDWIFKMEKLPDSSFNNFLTLKIAEMYGNGILVLLEIDSDLNKKTMWKNVFNNMQDFTQIMGVLLDNAIQATNMTDEKQIIIEIINDKKYIDINIFNTYSYNADLSLINSNGYTTKGKGHGYGLSLVKDIINMNNYIENTREINGKFFVQKLKIKK